MHRLQVLIYLCGFLCGVGDARPADPSVVTPSTVDATDYDFLIAGGGIVSTL